MRTDRELEPVNVEKYILFYRGHRVVLDAVLAKLYGVSTARLNQQYRRNLERFPSDFAFELNAAEGSVLMLQSATSKPGRGGRRKLPIVFTEHGAIMAAGVLNSKTAVRASIHVVRAFVRLRAILATHKELAIKLSELEKKYDAQFKAVFDAIKALMEPHVDVDPGPKKITGFNP